jgi:uncharacterized repeat protein (TIGR03803 family)
MKEARAMTNYQRSLQAFLAGQSRRRIGLAPLFVFAAGVCILCLAAQGQPTQLAFVQEPTTTQAGSTIAPSVTVAVEDVNGNVVTTDTSNVTVAVSPGTPWPGTLQGTLTVAAVSGVATFNNISVTAAGSSYTLQATDGALTAATSAAFTVTAAAPPFTYTLKLLGQFIGTNGDGPFSRLVMDGSGNLYGTTFMGGNGYGTVYEIAAGSNTITPLASFNDTNGAAPYGGMVIDGLGDLYGTTTAGGDNNNGTVFEVAAGSKAITKIASFASGSEGSWGDLLIDGSGNLFGTTYVGGDNNDGSVFEVPAGTDTIVTLASLNGTNGIGCHSGLAMDKFGNLYGTAWMGGANGVGTVYELPAGSHTITALVSFAAGGTLSPTGETPEGTPVVDGNGNIYGTTSDGGDGSWGTLFEITAASIAAGNPTITTLCWFGGGLADDGTPIGGLLMDGSGNLYGTTEFGGIGLGEVFEIASGTRTVTPLVSFQLSSPEGEPESGVIMDGSGNLYGTTPVGGAVSPYDGTVYELSPVAAAVNTLNVQSTPPTGLMIGSSTGDGGTTDYTVSSVAAGVSVNLQAPATDPTGKYGFSQWWVNDVAQPLGQQAITFTTAAGTTAVAQYVSVSTLNVQSAPPGATGLAITGTYPGTTPYTASSIPAGTNVNLIAPATDPTGYTFEYWTVNGSPITPPNKSVSFTTTAGTTTAVAQYTLNTYTLSVQSTPSGVVIGSIAGYGGTTNYTVSVAYGTNVDLEAPATDPPGLTFSCWTLNGTPQTSGDKEITFTMTAAASVVAVYSVDTYTMTVQSEPPVGILITSNTYDGGFTDYTVPTVAYGTSVNLEAPGTVPGGYTFLQWTLNGASLGVGQNNVTFAAPASFLVWGSVGIGDGQFEYPTGVAVAGNGNVYVADSENDRIEEFTSAGAYVTQWGSSGSGDGEFSGPTGIAIDSSGDVYVVDTYNNRIQEFTSAGVYVTQWGSEGPGSGQFEYPAGIAIDTAGTGNVYVADTYNNLIQEFTSAGTFITQWGGYGSGNGQFDFPTGIAVDSSSNVYVADTFNDLIQEFTSTGTFTTQWGGSGSGNGQFDDPSGVAVDSSGNVYVADTGNDLIQEFNSADTFITQWGGEGGDPGQFEYPSGIALNSAGNIYVADTDNNRMQEIFAQNILAVAEYTTTPITYPLTVESTPPSGVVIASDTSDGGTTTYTVPSVGYATQVDLTAPETDPTGEYTFAYWTVNGVTQTTGASISFNMPPEPATAVANYTLNNYTLTVQSTPLTGLAISGTYPGTTTYTVPSVGYGTGVTLTAPAVPGYTFTQWQLTGATGTPSGNSVSFTMPAGAVTAEAQYTLNTYTLSVQSTPPTGVVIYSGTSDGGTTPYSVPGGVAYLAPVGLTAPETDPTGEYTFAYWTVNGVTQTTGASISFNMPPEPATAVANYTLSNYTLTVQSTPLAGLAISGTYPGTTTYTAPSVGYGTSVTLTAPAVTGYTFTQWQLTGATPTGAPLGNSVSFTMPAGDVTAEAQYTVNTYTLTVQSTPLDVSITAGTYLGTTPYFPSVPYGTLVTLTAPATDTAGEAFEQWLVTGQSPEPDTSVEFTVTGPTTAVAQYAPILTVQSQNPASGVSITISPPDNNALSDGTTPLTREYNAGTSVTLTAALAASGNNFQNWLKNGADYSTDPTITVTAGYDTYTAVYLTPTAGYMLTVQSTPKTGVSIGTSIGQGGPTNYTTNYQIPGVGYGTWVNLTAPATDPDGDTFVQWTVYGAAQTAGQQHIEFTMQGATTAVAEYAPTGYSLTVESTPPTGVTITGQGGVTNYGKNVAQGTSVKLTAPTKDPAGYSFLKWTLNGAPQAVKQKNITFTMPAGTMTAVAEYTLNAYALTVQSDPSNLKITGTYPGKTKYGPTSVSYGTPVTLTAPATTGYYTFAEWTVNGAAQPFGQTSVAFTMDGDVTAVAEYNLGYMLALQSTPLQGVAIATSIGQGGTTNYTTNHSISGVAYGTPVNLQAPATDPPGYTFSQWTLNGAEQTPGDKSVSFTMDEGVKAVAQYTKNDSYTLSLQSTPLPGVSIATSIGQGGTTNYTTNHSIPGVGYGMPVNLQAPTAYHGDTFLQWTVNGAAQTAGQNDITFTMEGTTTGTTTAVAEYTASNYVLLVQSTPQKNVEIGSANPALIGTTDYYKIIAAGASVNLQAPETATSPAGAGYTFLQWTINGEAQTAGQNDITFTLEGTATGTATAVAEYTKNDSYTLTVQSTPKTKVEIGSTIPALIGTTDYKKSIAAGASVNLEAPATDPDGDIFAQWTLNGASQTAGQNDITFTMQEATTAVAEYAPAGYALTVESTPPTGVNISSKTGQGGVTNYGKNVASGTGVTLTAPAVTGYTFTQWQITGATGTPSGNSVSFTMPAGNVTAQAQYTLNGYLLEVKSTPTGVSVSIASTLGQEGTTTYTVPSIGYGTSVNLQAPGTNPAGDIFAVWTLNGAAQTAGQNDITFTMDGAVTAVAVYAPNFGYTLSVESTPAAKVVISSTNPGQNGTTHYTVPGVTYGTSVNLTAPTPDPAGFTFSQWTVNGAAQTAGQKDITFTMEGTTTAVAEYTANPGYTLSVKATPAQVPGQVIISNTSDGGTTPYTVLRLTVGTPVNLQAPVTDPAGYVFSQWVVNEALQPAGQKEITFIMEGATAAEAVYVKNTP